MPTENEIEAEAKKQCLRAFEPYTYGPYFDALRDECRRKARETLEARERAKEYAVISLLKERPKIALPLSRWIVDGPKSEAGRARIAEAQRRRWRAYREKRQMSVAS